MIKSISNQINKDIYCLYNNLHRDSIIDEEFAYYICQMIQDNQSFEDSLIVIHSKGGNLKSGTKVAEFIKKKYREVSYYVPERAGSTATLVSLSGDKLYLDEKSIMTPCDPQISTTKGIMVSVNDIRNYIAINGNGNLNPIDIAKYYSTLNYFKSLVNRLFSEDKRKKIIEYMLTQVESHEYPLREEDLIKMGIILGDTKELPEQELHVIHNIIKQTQSMRYDHIGSILLGPNTGYIYKEIRDEQQRKLSEGYEKVDTNKVLIKK